MVEDVDRKVLSGGREWLSQGPSAGVACECSTWAGNTDRLSMATNSLRPLCPQCPVSPARQSLRMASGHPRWIAGSRIRVWSRMPQTDLCQYTFN